MAPTWTDALDGIDREEAAALLRAAPLTDKPAALPGEGEVGRDVQAAVPSGARPSSSAR